MRNQETPKKRSIRSSELCVCLIEQNLLAAHHLQSILNGASHLRSALCDDLSHITKHSDAEVFIIDRGTLTFPLNKCLHCLRTQFSDRKALVIDRELTSTDIFGLLAYGVQGVLGYAEVAAQLETAVRVVSEGHLWVPADVLENYVISMAASRRAAQAGGLGLTPRETEVARLLQQQLSNKQISDALAISERTVKFHLARIYAKLAVQDRRSALEILDTLRLAREPTSQPVTTTSICTERRQHREAI